jgi:hypothetical protein
MILAASAALGGCTSFYGNDGYGYGGVSVGYGSGGYYGGYGDGYGGYGGYGDGYVGYGYPAYAGGYGYGSPYGGYAGYRPSYYGWYGNYYYPGVGFYIYDRSGRRHRWSDSQRCYWESRRDRRNSGRENWAGFRNPSQARAPAVVNSGPVIRDVNAARPPRTTRPSPRIERAQPRVSESAERRRAEREDRRQDRRDRRPD